MAKSHERTRKRRRAASRRLLLLGGTSLLLAALLLGLWVAEAERFSPHTSIEGIQVDSMEVRRAIEAVESAVRAKTVSLCDGDGQVLGETTLDQLTQAADIPEQIHMLLAQQRRSRGFFRFADQTQYDYTLSFAVDSATLESVLTPVLTGEDYVPRQAQDAQLVLDADGARIEPGDPGNIVDISACASDVSWYLTQEGLLADSLTQLQMEDALSVHARGVDDAVLNRQKRILDKLRATELTLLFCGGRSHTLSFEELLEAVNLDFNEKSVRITIREAGLIALVDRIVEELGADGVEAKYGNVRPTREYVYLTAADKGYILDRETLYAQVADAILHRRSGTVEAAYDYTWWLRANYGWLGYVDTAVEISLDNQYLWFYVDGVLVTETVVSTGCVATGSETNRGAFTVSYLQADTNLVGPTWNYHVDYWIPFDADIGLHDSYWRTDYGADYYWEDGSHGCVNTPLEPMSIVFANCHMGTAVIVH